MTILTPAGRLRSLLCVAFALWSVPLAADEPAPAQPAEIEAKKLVIHGYLSQAFAISDGYQVLGIPEDGTFDYRTAALLFRATISPKDTFVIQFSQERQGESPIMKVQNEIDLDWIFYQRELGAGTSLRVGRVKAPFGIYNESRFVGPLLPFFRAPDVFYGEGGFAFDHVDGAVLSKNLFGASRFSVDADLYLGEWSLLQADRVTRARAKKGLGGQLWLNTPLHGLRFGLAGNRYSQSAATGTKTHQAWAASMDGNFERFRVSAEFENLTSQGSRFNAWYALASVRVIHQLRLNLQASRAGLRIDLFRFDEELVRDYAAGLSYAFRPDLVAKAETHWTKGRSFEEPGVTLFSPPLKARYLILSLSALF